MRRRGYLALLPAAFVGCLGLTDPDMETVYSDSIAMLEVEPASVVVEEGDRIEIDLTVDGPGFIHLQISRRGDALFDERVSEDLQTTVEAETAGSHIVRVEHRTADGEITVRVET